MLPGLRFLFAAIVLSMSILIFGLGAAALLRAAHEEFASNPSRRMPPEPVFARSESEAPTLALLRTEPAADEAPEAVPVPPVETERLAAPTDDSLPPETEVPAAQPASVAETAPVQIEPLAATEAVRVAAIGETPPTETAATETVIVPPAPEGTSAATNIATLGDAGTVEKPTSAKPPRAKADQTASRERLRAQRAKERRRRMARQRARQAAAAAALQQPSDPFAPQPTITPRKR